MHLGLSADSDDKILLQPEMNHSKEIGPHDIL